MPCHSFPSLPSELGNKTIYATPAKCIREFVREMFRSILIIIQFKFQLFTLADEDANSHSFRTGQSYYKVLATGLLLHFFSVLTRRCAVEQQQKGGTDDGDKKNIPTTSGGWGDGRTDNSDRFESLLNLSSSPRVFLWDAAAATTTRTTTPSRGEEAQWKFPGIPSAADVK